MDINLEGITVKIFVIACFLIELARQLGWGKSSYYGLKRGLLSSSEYPIPPLKKHI